MFFPTNGPVEKNNTICSLVHFQPALFSWVTHTNVCFFVNLCTRQVFSPTHRSVEIKSTICFLVHLQSVLFFWLHTQTHVFSLIVRPQTLFPAKWGTSLLFVNQTCTQTNSWKQEIEKQQQVQCPLKKVLQQKKTQDAATDDCMFLPFESTVTCNLTWKPITSFFNTSFQKLNT